MESRKRTAESAPAAPCTPAKRQKHIPPINWDIAPFTPEEAPDGDWRTNAKGDVYLTCQDGSYHYFNVDGSYYYSTGRPGVSNANGRAIYISPSKERFYVPSSSPEDNEDGEFFEGVDWRTGQENVYWQDSTGKIQRSLRKHVEWLSIRLSKKYVGTDTETHNIFIADKDGIPINDGPNREESPEKALKLERDVGVVATDEVKIELEEPASADSFEDVSDCNGSPEEVLKLKQDVDAAEVDRQASEDGDVWLKVGQDYIKAEEVIWEVIDLTQENE